MVTSDTVCWMLDGFKDDSGSSDLMPAQCEAHGFEQNRTGKGLARNQGLWIRASEVRASISTLMFQNLESH